MQNRKLIPILSSKTHYPKKERDTNTKTHTKEVRDLRKQG